MKRFVFVGVAFTALLLIVGTQAGILRGIAETTSDGTRFTATWSQGCYSWSLGWLGLNACHTTKPWYCPVWSDGNPSASTDYRQRADICGCPAGEEPDGTTCVPCPDACASQSECAASQCRVTEACDPNGYACPEWVGWTTDEGRIRGYPNGDGTYSECWRTSDRCSSGRDDEYSGYIAPLNELCPNMASTRAVYGDQDCVREDDPTDPDPGDDTDPTDPEPTGCDACIASGSCVACDCGGCDQSGYQCSLACEQDACTSGYDCGTWDNPCCVDDPSQCATQC